MIDAAEVRRDLEHRKRELGDRLGRIRRDRLHTDAAVSPRFSEQAVQRENDEVLERLEAGTAADLRQVSHALERLDRGLYGECEVCGFRIEPDRLSALPWTTRCASCAGARAPA